MRLAVIGVGDAGCRIVDEILSVERRTGRNLSRGNVALINTTEPPLTAARNVPEERKLLIGDVHPELGGKGVDGDPDLGADVAREELNEIRRAFDLIEFTSVDGLLVIAGLGRGTGGGAGPVVIEQLDAICDKPVYGLVTFPGAEEGSQRALNATRSLQSFVAEADSVIGFDNDAWREDDGTPEQDYGEANRELANRVVTLFAAGEFDPPSPAENRMDPSDIMRTLDTGGLASIGYATTDVPRSFSIVDWLRGLSLPWGSSDMDEKDDRPETDAVKINRLVRRSALSKLTLPCEVSSAERALILLSGPSRALSRKGFESGRYWLEKEADTVEVMAGDEPHERSSELTAVVLFSNVTEVPRIDEMKEQALRARDREAKESAAIAAAEDARSPSS